MFKKPKVSFVAALVIPASLLLMGAANRSAVPTAASAVEPALPSGISLSIDPAAALSTADRVVITTGAIDCPAGASFRVQVTVFQKFSHGGVATGPAHFGGVARGTTGKFDCGLNPGWIASAFFRGSSLLQPGFAEVCATAHVSGKHVHGRRSVRVCQQVELIGG